MADAKLPPVPATVTATWRGGHRMEVRGPKGAPIVIDSDKEAGPGPVDTLLGALASCTSVDVVDILAKRRTPVKRLEIVVNAERQGEVPRRVTRVQLEYHIDGAGVDQVHANRAITLAIEKYCSVGASLAPDIVLSSTLVLNGERHPACGHSVRG